MVPRITRLNSAISLRRSHVLPTVMSNKSNLTVATMGIDIGKNSFHARPARRYRAAPKVVTRPSGSAAREYAAVSDRHGSLCWRASPEPQAAIARSRCTFDAGEIRAAYSKGQKNHFRDAEAIAEAVGRPTMKFVATKTADELDLQALHPVRERLVSQRTGIINQIRAFPLERGVAVRQGLRFLRTELPIILATRSDVLSPRMMRVIQDLAGDWRRLFLAERS
jgi:hypothetical protein